MLNVFKRLLKIFQAEAYSAVDKIEDPVILIEQGLRDLRKDYEASMKNLAEAKPVLFLLKKNLKDKEQIAAEYEEKAILFIKQAQDEQISEEESDRLASEALIKKKLLISESVRINSDFVYQEKMIIQLEDKVKKLKSHIDNWQNELVMLKSRAKIASSSKKISQQLVQLNSDSPSAMLEEMSKKINEQEALAQAYDELNKLDNIDEEINKALESEINLSVVDSLAELKAKVITENK